MPLITKSINMITSTKIWYYIENILIVGLLFYCIKFLTDYDNVYYQTWKNEAAAKAILAFTAIVFIIRKVKLLNWQSLVATLLFGVIAIERMHFWADSEDILAVIKPQMAAEWLSLMIVIDMILYRNVNNLFKGVNYLLIIYALMTIGMIWRRHDRMDPVVLVFPMFLFALVKMDEEKVDWFTRRFIDGWFFSFIYVMIKSFTERPYEGTRYYGCFLNIGQFGIFMVCCFTIAVFTIYYCKEKFGRKSFGYLLGIVWILALLYMFYIIDTRTSLSGLLLCLLTLFLFVRKDTAKKTIRRRFFIVFMITLSSIIIFVILLNICTSISNEWLIQNKNGALAPLCIGISRFQEIASFIEGLPLKEKIFRSIDYYTSGRLTIAQRYSEFFNYDGNGSIGFEIEEHGYWVFTAHNTYIQFLVEYGYVTIIELLALLFFSIAYSIKCFIKSHSYSINLLTLLWLSSMIGVWLGEANTFFFPITFFGFMFIARLLPKEEK